MKTNSGSNEAMSYLAVEAMSRKGEIEKFKEQLVKKALSENDSLDPKQVREALDTRPASQYLRLLDNDKDRMVEAELQKRLTKAVPFLRGKLT